VSGLARGVDTTAHTTALEGSGRTVAVLGCGTKHYYPAENRELQDRIAAEGLVISQFFPEVAPRRQQFPMRNAVMSGYSRATIVVEAGEKSGARIQARQAIAHGRPVILTNLVIDSNEWARQLVSRPGVHVASGTAEVMKLVEAIVAADDEMDEMLAATRG
jgi:DNA processing protein